MEEYVQSSRTHSCITLTCSHPQKLNAIGFEACQQLLKHLQDIDTQTKSQKIHSIVLKFQSTLSTSGKKISIAGGRLDQIAQDSSPIEKTKAFFEQMNKITQLLKKIPVPIVTAFDGDVIGGGAELVLFGDIRIASSEAHIYFKQLKVGMATGWGGCQRLIQLVGLSKAQKILLLSERLSARDAVAQSILHKAVSQTQLDQEVDQVTAHFATIDIQSLAAQKQMLNTQSQPEELKIFFSQLHNDTFNQLAKKFKNKGA